MHTFWVRSNRLFSFTLMGKPRGPLNKFMFEPMFWVWFRIGPPDLCVHKGCILEKNGYHAELSFKFCHFLKWSWNTTCLIYGQFHTDLSDSSSYVWIPSGDAGRSTNVCCNLFGHTVDEPMNHHLPRFPIPAIYDVIWQCSSRLSHFPASGASTEWVRGRNYHPDSWTNTNKQPPDIQLSKIRFGNCDPAW